MFFRVDDARARRRAACRIAREERSASSFTSRVASNLRRRSERFVVFDGHEHVEHLRITQFRTLPQASQFHPRPSRLARRLAVEFARER